MKISRVIIKNYRNLKNVDVHLNNTVALIGENNSGKSNFLRAIRLPLFAEDFGSYSKTLSWLDINEIARQEYYDYVMLNQKGILGERISPDDFVAHLPSVSVELQIAPDETEGYFVKDLATNIDKNGITYAIRYAFYPAKVQDILNSVKCVLKSEGTIDEANIQKVKMNLLPVEYYAYSVQVPEKGSIPYDVIKQFKYTALEAERDEFSRTSERLGSKALIKLLQKGLTDTDKLKVEKEYSDFFDVLKNISNMDSIINWQEYSDIEDAQEFFSHISILPNMPPMHSLLNSVRLGYSEEALSLQGLGYRNIILLFVLLNSLLEKQRDYALNAVMIEEPEAHLCINNIRLLISFLNVFTQKNSLVQLFYSTHSTEFINKMDLRNVVIMHNGQAYSFVDELTPTQLDYLTKNPNLDLFKLFFSKKCILVEGISEEMLIRAYLTEQKALNDIELLSFHKGFIDIIKIWKKVNSGSGNKLGIIRDYDDQDKAKENHDKFNDDKNICVRTTHEYTLEPEIVKTGNNYSILRDKYGETFGWTNFTEDEMQQAWRNAKASEMLRICQDLANGELKGFQLPQHIKEVLDFLS